MKIKFALIILGLVVLSACSTTQKSIQPSLNGKDLMQRGKYEAAFNYYVEQINAVEAKGKDVDCELIKMAGKAAYKAGQIEKAIPYFEKALFKKAIDEEMVYMYADCYKQIDNLSKEIAALEKYVDEYPKGENITSIKARLFETCLESEDWNLSENLWKGFGEEAMLNPRLLNVYLKANIAQKNDEKAESLAKELLKIDSENIAALEIMAKKFFWKAENRYQEETEAYNKKKTRKQYAKLLKALDIVTVDFKRSLGYFKKLYGIAQDKEYAKYLGNIYARLDDKEKATYYKNRAR